MWKLPWVQACWGHWFHICHFFLTKIVSYNQFKSTTLILYTICHFSNWLHSPIGIFWLAENNESRTSDPLPIDPRYTTLFFVDRLNIFRLIASLSKLIGFWTNKSANLQKKREHWFLREEVPDNEWWEVHVVRWGSGRGFRLGYVIFNLILSLETKYLRLILSSKNTLGLPENGRFGTLDLALSPNPIFHVWLGSHLKPYIHFWLL